MSAALEKTGQVLTVLSEQLEATGDELRKRADGEESVRKRADAALQVCPLPPPPCRAHPVGVILGHSTLATAPWPQHLGHSTGGPAQTRRGPLPAELYRADLA